MITTRLHARCYRLMLADKHRDAASGMIRANSALKEETSDDTCAMVGHSASSHNSRPVYQ
jgi:hypothetical protein